MVVTGFRLALVLGVVAILAATPAALLSARPAGAADADVLDSRVLVTPRREAVLSAELAGRILRMPVEEAGRFAEGDELVAFACDLHRAALAEEQASESAARATLENRRELAELRSTGTLDVALAEAEARRTAARVAMQRGMVERCVLRAPFHGRVVERLGKPFESVAAGTPLLSILDDSELELEMVVPSAWLAWLRPGDAFDVRIDETGSTHTAVVRTIGARIDAVSQAVAVRGAFDARPEDLLAGMSGTALFRPSAEAR